MATMRASGLAVLVLAVAAGAACTVTTSGAQCNSDENCQTGQYCYAPGGQGGSCQPCNNTCEPCNCASGLTCTRDASHQPVCHCPTRLDTDGAFYADAANGALGTAAVPPTGVQSPPQCRFKSLEDALAAANARGPGSTVTAVGSQQGTPPTVMTFIVGGPLVVEPGVKLASDLGASYYAVTAPATTMPFVTVRAGATLSGFQIQNVAGTGDAIRSDCSQGSGTVAISGVVVSGAGSGTPTPRFKTGVHHSGSCPLDLEGSTIVGASESGVILNTAATSSVTLLNNVVTGNDAATTYLGAKRKGGGLLLNLEVPALVAHGNQFYGNKGDQILIVTASGAVNLSGAACSTANVIACYDSPAGGVGVFASTPTVDASNNRWPVASPSAGTDFLGTVTVAPVCSPATTLTCPP